MSLHYYLFILLILLSCDGRGFLNSKIYTYKAYILALPLFLYVTILMLGVAFDDRSPISMIDFIRAVLPFLVFVLSFLLWRGYDEFLTKYSRFIILLLCLVSVALYIFFDSHVYSILLLFATLVFIHSVRFDGSGGGALIALLISAGVTGYRTLIVFFLIFGFLFFIRKGFWLAIRFLLLAVPLLFIFLYITFHERYSDVFLDVVYFAIINGDVGAGIFSVVTTHRSDIWMHYIDLGFNWLGGGGYEYYCADNGACYGPHNSIIMTLVREGYAGLFAKFLLLSVLFAGLDGLRRIAFLAFFMSFGFLGSAFGWLFSYEWYALYCLYFKYSASLVSGDGHPSRIKN